MATAAASSTTESTDPDPARVLGSAVIPMADLARHHAPLSDALHAAFARVLRSGRFIAAPGAEAAAGGGEVAALEREAARALGVGCAVGLSSGTDALLATLMALDVGRGDEIITPAFSFVASADVIARLGARPRFVDIDPVTLNLDPARVAEALGPNTKAVLAVHLFGTPAAGVELRAACAAHGAQLVEDGAQAIGALDVDGRPVGRIGRAAALSFFPSKNLGALGDGGMVITDDRALAARIRLLRSHGTADRLRHEAIGGNFRLDELQAAWLRVKLPHLARWTEQRRRIAQRYRHGLGHLPLGLPPPAPGAVWNQFVVRVPGGARDGLAAWLGARGISTAIYYPLPLPLQPCFAELGHRPGEFPVAEAASSEVLALPMYAELSPDQVDRVTGSIAEFFAGSRSAPAGG